MEMPDAPANVNVGSATARECGCRRHGAAESESHCKNDHSLTQHNKPPSRMLFCARRDFEDCHRSPDMCLSSRRRIYTAANKPTSTKNNRVSSGANAIGASVGKPQQSGTIHVVRSSERGRT